MPEAHVPALPVDAHVVEEDTFLVMSAPAVLPEQSAPVEQLAVRAREMEPVSPGQVVLRPGTPPTILVVVHDLEREPTATGEWIVEGVRRSLALARAEGWSAITLPLLGTRHGPFGPRAAATFLRAALLDDPEAAPDVWIPVPADLPADALEPLAPLGLEVDLSA